eukprot:GHRR01001195.1.p1 GENE.GHRR01001195.1~~GHRR01001195.1.p1  ORF type:complete len:1086 (+),score=285.66 GHRR01001195.1:203-3460(+)
MCPRLAFSTACAVLSSSLAVVAGAPKCTLRYQTSGTAVGKPIQVTCSGGTTTAHTIDESLQFNSANVTWSSSGCRFQAVGASNKHMPQCIFTVCSTGDSSSGQAATLLQTFVNSQPVEKADVFLCIAGASNVRLIDTTIMNTGMTGLHVYDAAVVTLDKAIIKTNGPASTGGGILVGDNAVAIISNSSVSGNTAVLGGGVAATGHARVVITNHTDITGNSVKARNAVMAGSLPIGAGGAGVAVLGNATVTISNYSTITGNGAETNGANGYFGDGGGIWVGDGASVVLTNHSRINSNGKMMSGGGVYLNNSASLILDSSISIEANTAGVTGGGVYAGGSSRLSVLAGSSISSNAADRDGGGVYLMGNSTLVVQASSIGNNSAVSTGGGIYMNDQATLQIAKTSSVEGNHAGLMGGGIFAFGSGYIALSSNSSLVGNTALDSGGGVYLGNDVTVTFADGVTFGSNTAALSGTEDIKAWPNNTLVYGPNLGFDASSPNITWTRTNCLVGEVPGRNGYCELCMASTYSFDSSLGCSVCPSAKANCPGGSQMIPLAGYWRSGPYSAQVHQCDNTEACLYNGTCAQGHTGNLCGACAAGYGSSGLFKCVQCLSSRGAILTLWLLGAVLLLLLITYMLHTTLRENQEMPDSRDVTGSPNLLKPLIRHAQYLLIISNLKVPWPGAMTGMFKVLALLYSAGSSDLLSLDCVLNDASSVPKAIQRQLIYLFAPLGFFLAAMLLQLAAQHCYLWWNWKRNAASADSSNTDFYMQQHTSKQCSQQLHVLAHKVPALVLIVIFFFYPSLVRVGLIMFACYKIDNANDLSDPYRAYAVASSPTGYWVLSINQACYEGWHRPWALALGIPCTLLFCIGVPLIIGIVLYRNRARLDSPRFAGRVGFLYHNYKPQTYYWEVCMTMQTALLVLVAVFSYNLGPFFAVLLLTVMFLLFVVADHVQQPYAIRVVHVMQLTSYCCLLFTCLVAFSLFNLNNQNLHAYPEVIAWITLLLNVVFFCWGIYNIIVCSMTARLVAEALQSLKTWLLQQRAAKFAGSHVPKWFNDAIVVQAAANVEQLPSQELVQQRSSFAESFRSVWSTD